MHLGLFCAIQRTTPVELGTREDEQTSQFVVVQLLDRIEQIAVERHQATDSGANRRVLVRRSVRVHPWGGVIRSAWLAHSR
jgi:lipoate synthase